MPHDPALIVGREVELEQLQRWWIQALEGDRQVVFITGEAGIGKTTVVDTFVAQLPATATLWVGRGQCIEQYGVGEAYLPLLEALGRLCRGLWRHPSLRHCSGDLSTPGCHCASPSGTCGDARAAAARSVC